MDDGFSNFVTSVIGSLIANTIWHLVPRSLSLVGPVRHGWTVAMGAVFLATTSPLLIIEPMGQLVFSPVLSTSAPADIHLSGGPDPEHNSNQSSSFVLATIDQPLIFDPISAASATFAASGPSSIIDPGASFTALTDVVIENPSLAVYQSSLNRRISTIAQPTIAFSLSTASSFIISPKVTGASVAGLTDGVLRTTNLTDYSRLLLDRQTTALDQPTVFGSLASAPNFTTTSWEIPHSLGAVTDGGRNPLTALQSLVDRPLSTLDQPTAFPSLAAINGATMSLASTSLGEVTDAVIENPLMTIDYQSALDPQITLLNRPTIVASLAVNGITTSTDFSGSSLAGPTDGVIGNPALAGYQPFLNSPITVLPIAPSSLSTGLDFTVFREVNGAGPLTDGLFKANSMGIGRAFPARLIGCPASNDL